MILQSKGMQSTVILLLRDRVRNLACDCSEMIYSWWSPKARCVCRWSGSCGKQARIKNPEKKRVSKKAVGRSLRLQLYPWWVKTWKLISISGSPEAIPFVPNITYKMSWVMMSGAFIGLSARVDGPYGVGIPQIILLNSWLFDLGVAAHIVGKMRTFWPEQPLKNDYALQVSWF